MTNVYNRSLLEGEYKDFGSAIDALKAAMGTEAFHNGNDPAMEEFFQKEAEKCAKAKEVYDQLYEKFRKDLASRLICAGLDEFAQSVLEDDYTLLGY